MAELATVTAEHASERGRVIARVGIGTCPHCGHEGEAEAGRALFCPDPTCAGPVLAVLGDRT